MDSLKDVMPVVLHYPLGTLPLDEEGSPLQYDSSITGHFPFEDVNNKMCSR